MPEIIHQHSNVTRNQCKVSLGICYFIDMYIHTLHIQNVAVSLYTLAYALSIIVCFLSFFLFISAFVVCIRLCICMPCGSNNINNEQIQQALCALHL